MIKQETLPKGVGGATYLAKTFGNQLFLCVRVL